jgi:hypothetical protein
MTTLVLALAIAASPAAADEGIDPFLKAPTPQVPESGLSLAIRGGYAIPMGSITGAAGDDLSQLMSGAIPLQFDLGWRFSPHWYAGAFFQYAFGSVGSTLACATAGVSCSASDIRFGVDVVYTFTPRSSVMPWIGLGAGYEIAKITLEGNGQSVDVATLKGFEFAHVGLGVDFRVATWLRVGPFATLTLGQYSSFDTQFDPTTNTIGPSQSIDITNKALHEWLQLGIKATFDL